MDTTFSVHKCIVTQTAPREEEISFEMVSERNNAGPLSMYRSVGEYLGRVHHNKIMKKE